MRAEADDNIPSTAISSVSTINSKERANRKSPTNTEASLPQSALAVSRPRLLSDSSITSSCSKVALWINSTAAANNKARLSAAAVLPVAARAPARVSIGRMRLPPAAMRWLANSGIIGTSEAMRAMITSFTRVTSSASKEVNVEMLGCAIGKLLMVMA